MNGALNLVLCSLVVFSFHGVVNAQPSAEVHAIGLQQWASRNLEVTTFRNGDPIPEARSELDWKRAAKQKKPAWCYFRNDHENGVEDGKLYNWYAVNDPRGLAPEGWHIPSKPELEELVQYLDAHYQKISEVDSLFAVGSENSTEDSFHTYQGGFRLTNGSFQSSGQYGFWWGTTCYLSTHSWLKHIRTGSGFKVYSLFHHGDGFSVRCIRDN